MWNDIEIVDGFLDKYVDSLVRIAVLDRLKSTLERATALMVINLLVGYPSFSTWIIHRALIPTTIST